MISRYQNYQHPSRSEQFLARGFFFLAILMVALAGCNRYPHTNIYDPEVSGTKYEVILSVSEISIEEFDCGNSERCFYLVPVIRNSGPYMADYVEVTVSENDPVVTIRSEHSASYGQILPGEESWYRYHFQLAVPPNATIPHSTEVFFEMTEATRGPWFDTLQVMLQ